MIAHLRADLIRLGRRWDVWILAGAVLALAVFGFLASYQSLLASRQQWLDMPLDPGETLPPDLLASIDAQLADYAYPHSLLQLLDGLPTVLGVVGLVTAMTIGLEFGWGTIRTVLISSPDRVRLLASRLLLLGAYGLVLLAALVVLGVGLPALLPMLGTAPPPSPVVEPVLLGGTLAASLLGLVFVVAVTALLAVVTRNPALPILVLLIWFLFEGVVANLAVWTELHLELVAGSLPLTSLEALIAGARDPVSYGLAPPPDPTVVLRPLWLSFAVVAGWAAVCIAAAVGLLRRADIHE